MSQERTDQTAATDSQLVIQAQTRWDEPPGRRAAAELLTRYQQPVYQWCMRYARDHDAALDLAQDVLLKAYEKLKGFEQRSSFSSWLFVMTRNHCLNEQRRKKRFVDADVDFDGYDAGETPPDEQLIEIESEEQLLEVIRRTLDEHEQRALWMRCVERLSVDEITETMGIADRSGARALLQRARRKLARAMD